jgi:hypothetical protein
MFSELSRIGDDQAGLTQEMAQNSKFHDYMVQNFYAQDCAMKRPIEFATSQVNVNYVAAGGETGKQVGIGGCNVDQNTALLFGLTTHPRSRLSLLQRPFVTVPFLGKGSVNADLETQILQNKWDSSRKSETNSSEMSYIPVTHYPLIPSISNKITNPDYLVESWTRGGDSTRQANVEGSKKS